MNRVFQPGAGDLGIDPNQTIEIQQKVKELLEANRQRQQGLKQEIQERGAWALPGLINATYVWMNQLEDESSQEMIAVLMARLAQDNPAAVDLLFRDGVLGAPFPIPQSIARRALERLDWKPHGKDAQRLKREIASYKELDDTQTMLDLYALLLRTGSERDFSSALGQCEDWARRSLKQSGDLLALLTRLSPSQAEKILTNIILTVKDKYNDENIAKALLTPLRPILPAWLQDGVLLRVSVSVLRQVRTHRHTTVEYLWMYATEDCQSKNLQLWQELLGILGDQIQQERTETLYRYWFRAVGEVNEMDYIVKQTRAKADLWGTMAALQLFFQRRSGLAKQALKDLEIENSVRYNHAKDKYDWITKPEHRKHKRKLDEGEGPAVPLAESKD